jgi:hypothetical protein
VKDALFKERGTDGCPPLKINQAVPVRLSGRGTFERG